MAIISTKKESALELTLKLGIDENGEDRLTTKTMGKVKVDATDQDIYDVADAISQVKNYPVVAISRKDEFKLASTN